MDGVEHMMIGIAHFAPSLAVALLVSLPLEARADGEASCAEQVGVWLRRVWLVS